MILQLVDQDSQVDQDSEVTWSVKSVVVYIPAIVHFPVLLEYILAPHGGLVDGEHGAVVVLHVGVAERVHPDVPVGRAT